MTSRGADRILIRDLLVRCIIGVNEEERHLRQDVLVNLVIHTDLSAAGQSDRLADTCDYKALKKRIVALIEGSGFQLLERLAESVAALCLEDPRIECVEVTIDKPGALRFARSVAVAITRSRRSHG